MATKVSIGRIVHFVSRTPPHAHLPAIVCAAREDPDRTQLCDLKVFGPVMDPEFGVTAVPQDEETKTHGTWHWPEMVD